MAIHTAYNTVMDDHRQPLPKAFSLERQRAYSEWADPNLASGASFWAKLAPKAILGFQVLRGPLAQ